MIKLMNIHPMFVHFPVALFSLYSVLEIIRFPKLTRQIYYFYVKAIIVIVGAGMALITIPTGIMAKLVYSGNVPIEIINTHEVLAICTTIIFCIIAFLYIIGWINKNRTLPSSSSFWNFLVQASELITEKWLGVILALIGLGLISTVGAFGGLIAYGPTNDPISAFIYSFFRKI